MKRKNRKMFIVGAAVLCALWFSGCSSPLEGLGVKPAAPGAPILKAGKASFHVQWEETSLAETYQVYLSINETPATVPIKTGLTEPSVTLDGLVNETTYYVWVQAVNRMGKSPLSDAAKKTLTLESPLITGLTAGNGSMTVTWNTVGMADSYNVYYADSATPPESPAQTGITGTTANITGLANDTTYYVWVEAVNSGGAMMGEAGSITLDLQAPQPVLTPEIGSSIIVNWKPVSFADSYNLYYADSATPPASPVQTGITGTSITITGLINNTTYYVWVEAVNSGGTKMSDLVSGLSGPVSQEYTVYSEAEFTQAIAGIDASQAAGYYYITLHINITGSGISFPSTSVEKTIVIKGDTALRTIYKTGEFFFVDAGNTLVLDNNIKLIGNDKQLGGLWIKGGTFVMKAGSRIEGAEGSGVYVSNGGTFIMEGGKISGNTGSGVHVSSGTFTMEGGKISGNTAKMGGGVYVSGGGTFTMEGGEISGNTATPGSGFGAGGGVLVEGSGRFIKSGGGIITDTNTGIGKVAYVLSPNRQRNITAGPEVNMDSNLSGSAGGWE
jgi:hypothetical protein